MEQVHLFFSHSSKDDDFGRRLVADLRAHLGEDAVWYDAAGGLSGGEEWWDRIVAEVTARNTFLVLLSPDALSSAWVRQEMSIAYSQHVRLGKRLIPLMYRACEMPADWQLIQALRFTDDLPYDERITTLLRDLGYSNVVTPRTLTVTSTVTVPTSIATRTETPKERLVARLIQEVHTAFGRENWRQVLLRARTLQEEVPEAMTPQLWQELGLAAVELREGGIALAALNQTLAEDPYDVPTLRGKVQAFALLNQFDEARQLLERVQSYIPMDDTEPQLALLAELISVLNEMREWEEMLAVCEQALILDPTNAIAWANKGNALFHLHSPTEAVRACDKAISINPQLASAWQWKSVALRELGNNEEASESARRYSKLTSN